MTALTPLGQAALSAGDYDALSRSRAPLIPTLTPDLGVGGWVGQTITLLISQMKKLRLQGHRAHTPQVPHQEERGPHWQESRPVPGPGHPLPSCEGVRPGGGPLPAAPDSGLKGGVLTSSKLSIMKKMLG